MQLNVTNNFNLYTSYDATSAFPSNVIFLTDVIGIVIVIRRRMSPDIQKTVLTP